MPATTLFGTPLAQVATLVHALLLFAQPDPAFCNRIFAAEIQKHGSEAEAVAYAAPSPSAPSADDAAAQEMPLEDKECQAAMLKCLGAPEKPAGKAAKRSGSLVEQESTAGVGANASAAGLAFRAEAHGFGFECTHSEFEHFKKKFGPNRADGSLQPNFGYKEICKERNVVWLYPEHDHNGAFAINNNVCHRLLGWSDIACSVQVRRVGTLQEAHAYLERFPADSIMHLVLGGHGHGMALRWGSGADGWFGVLEWGRPVAPSYMVTATRPVYGISQNKQRIEVFDKGYVINVDSDEDAFVYFDGAGYNWVSHRDFNVGSFTIEQSGVAEFMQRIKSKMQRHGSIFLDSCKSATSDYSPNLAQSVARWAGKGVRVIGSEVSFGKVDVKRFSGGWHASLNVPKLQHAQRIFVNAEAECPSMAGRRKPDKDGNCGCPEGQSCSLRSGERCPAARNHESGTNFLPFCGESWAQDPCLCSRPPSPDKQEECPSMAVQRKPDKDGNCRCREGQTCSTRSGKPCRAAGENGTSDTFFLPSCGEGSAEDACLCSWPSSSASGEAKCPSMAGQSEPDQDGNCECRGGRPCATRSGRACPVAKRIASGSHFLPFCAESSEEDPCACSPPSSASRLRAPKFLLLLSMLR